MSEKDLKIEKYLEDNCEPITEEDVDEQYDNMLNETTQTCEFCSSYGASRILKEVDPVAYRCGRADFEDTLNDDYIQFGDVWYKKDDVVEAEEALEEPDKEEV